ncbi:MAG: NADH:flavin oxidoreductase [Acetobacteraceae bacterium]|nr:NADH:flavin oxidoreductase [Acetobacteraceae bacterium]
MTPPFLEPGRIGPVALPNRLVRAPTSETMATEDGEVTPDLRRLYGELARGGAGLLLTGHIFVRPDGQCSPRQMALHDDRFVPGLARLVREVHAGGARIFAELSHAGSQTMMPGLTPLAPSGVSSAIYPGQPRGMTGQDIAEVIAAFGAAAARARAAGFDGIHIHGGNGYLAAQFASPASNRRDDDWGGDAAGRSRFLLAVLAAVRDGAGPGLAVTARYGVMDSAPGGLSLEEGLARLEALADAGLDAVEPTYNLMRSYRENIRPYVAVGATRALRDWVAPRLWRPAAPQAYYRPLARAIKARMDLPVILVGGVRGTDVMEEVLRSGDADFLSMARPLVREPDLPKQLAGGRRGVVDCVSCNICLAHDGHDALKCWRRNPVDLLRHAAWRLARR